MVSDRDSWPLFWLIVAVVLGASAFAFALAQSPRDSRTPRSPSQVGDEIGRLEHVQRDGEARAYLRGAIDALKWQAGIAGAQPPSQIVQRDGKGVGE